MTRDDRIRLRSYDIWQREGRPEGRQDHHWIEATREIDEEDTAERLRGAEREGSALSEGRPAGREEGRGPEVGRGTEDAGSDRRAREGKPGPCRKSGRESPDAGAGGGTP